MKVELKLHANCSEWDQEINTDDWIIPDAVLIAIEEAKMQLHGDWDK